MGDDTVRFTLELPEDVNAALEEHCDVQTKRASSVVGSKVKVGKSKAIEALLRKAFKMAAAD